MQSCEILQIVIRLTGSVGKVTKGQLHCYLFLWLLVRAHLPVVLELLLVPVITGHIVGFLNIFENLVAQCSQLATIRNFLCIGPCEVYFAGLLHDYLWNEVLLRRYILGMEWVHRSDIPMLDSHVSLVAINSIFDLEVIEDFLLHCDSITAFSRLYLFCRNFQVDLRAKWPKVFIKSFLAA